MLQYKRWYSHLHVLVRKLRNKSNEETSLLHYTFFLKHEVVKKTIDSQVTQFHLINTSLQSLKV